MEGGVRDWLAGLTRREVALLALLGVAAVAGGGLWYLRSLPEPVAIAASPPSPSPTAAADLIVHVAGWVHEPGVYELSEGDRVIDAIREAGGPRRGAELSALNLAALLTDAQQVVVPPPVPKSATGSTGEAPTTTTGETLVNVNTATAEELETLSGIGEVLAAAIIQYREENGPFTSVDQLIEVSGIGEVTLEEIRDFVTV